MEHINTIVERNVGNPKAQDATVRPFAAPQATSSTISDNDAKLKELAIWFRSNDAQESRATQGYRAEMIRIALKKAEIIKEGRSLTSADGFENWTKEALGIGSSHAYNYIKLLNNLDVVNFAVHTTGQLEIAHIFALLPTRDESEAVKDVREKVMQSIDEGKTPSVAQINEYKAKAKKAEQEAAQARKDADEWRVSAQTQQRINEQNLDLIDKKANEKLKEKQTEIEQAALNAAAAEYQATIDSLNDTVSNQRAKLATIERTGERQLIEEQINRAQAELQTLTVAKNQAAYESELRNIAAHVMESLTFSRTELIAAGTSALPIEDNTFNVLMDAHEFTEKLSRMFFDLANPTTLTIEE